MKKCQTAASPALHYFTDYVTIWWIKLIILSVIVIALLRFGL